MAIIKPTETPHGLVADYWVLANYVVNVRDMTATGTYALWAHEAAYETNKPVIDTVECQAPIEVTDDAVAISSKLQETAMTSVLAGGEPT